MPRRLFVPLMIAVMILSLRGGPEVQADEPVVRILLFHSVTCPHCRDILENYLPGVHDKYGAQIEIHLFELSQSEDNYRLLLALEKEHGISEEDAGIPMIFIGDQYLMGSNVIQAKLEPLIDRYLAQGVVELPYLEQGLSGDTVTTTELPIHLAYFLKGGCQECARATLNLGYLTSLYPQLVITEFHIEESSALSEWLGERYGVPEEKRLTTPMVFVGEHFLVGDDVSVDKLQAVLEQYVTAGVGPTWEDFDADQAEASILERFKSFGVLTVMGAGLLDGLNPCAFATIVFFVSYLAFLERKGREILAVGAAFALGVFLTYLLVGVGLLKVLERLPLLTMLGSWVYGLTAVLCLTLAIFSILDYRKARRGKAKDMTLRIPLRLRRRINSIIRQGAQAQALAPVAFVTGFAVSIIELACTGQVYLPTIIFVMGVPEMQVRALLYLLLYNLVFILPLIVVFMLAFFGTTSEQLGRLVSRHTATVKLITSGLFLVLTGWLIYTLV